MEDGRWQPCDARPSALSGVVVLEHGVARIVDRSEARERIKRGEKLYVLHNTWCPGSRAGKSDRARSRPRTAARKGARAPFARSKAPTRQGELFT